MIEAISLSPCTKLRPGISFMRVERYSVISVWGVIGYPAKNRQPALRADSASASLPCMTSFFAIRSSSFYL